MDAFVPVSQPSIVHKIRYNTCIINLDSSHGHGYIFIKSLLKVCLLYWLCFVI